MFKSDDICTQVMQSKEPLLEIKNLHAGIDGNVILNGIDIEIGPGEIHAIMGRNGSGKTTTANIVMGHPDFDVEDGEIKLMGNDLLDLEPWKEPKKEFSLVSISSSSSWASSWKLSKKISCKY